MFNAGLGWWADPIAGYVLVFYAAREVRAVLATPPGSGMVEAADSVHD